MHRMQMHARSHGHARSHEHARSLRCPCLLWGAVAAAAIVTAAGCYRSPPLPSPLPSPLPPSSPAPGVAAAAIAYALTCAEGVRGLSKKEA